MKNLQLFLLVFFVMLAPCAMAQVVILKNENKTKTMSFSYAEAERLIMNGGSVAGLDDVKLLNYDFEIGEYKSRFWHKAILRCVEWPLSGDSLNMELEYDTLYDPKLTVYVLPSDNIKVIMFDDSNPASLKMAVITSSDFWTCENPLQGEKWHHFISKEFKNQVIDYTIRRYRQQ